MNTLEILQTQIGFSSFRGRQAEVIDQVLAAQSALVIWPTGSGKSLCYQVPALAWDDGVVLVVSPLIALMEDQIKGASKKGLPFAAIHSGLGKAAKDKVLKRLRAGELRLLYLTPERFRSDEFWRSLGDQPVRLLAIDEAHCISQWGHDFRPEYSRLGEVRERLGRPPTLALTATATAAVQADILKVLGLSEDAPVFWDGVERENLFLSVVDTFDESEKIAALKEALNSTARPAIVYFSLITTLHRVAEELHGRVPDFDVYHGDLNPRRRSQAQADFLSGQTPVIFATPAFGLGVDKPDVRQVIHFDIPGSIEAYFQEVGRAGRDGQDSHCTLFYRAEDLEVHMNFIQWATPEPSYIRALYEKLERHAGKFQSLGIEELRSELSFKNKRDYRLETALTLMDRWEIIRWPHRDLKKLEILGPLAGEWLDEDLWKKRQKQLQMKLLELVRWAQSEECRKKVIYRYFGWPKEDDYECGFCDRCLERGVKRP